MNRTCVVVHEFGRRWIEHVRARLHGTPFAVAHTATAKDLIDRLTWLGPLILVVELGQPPDVTLELIERVSEIRTDATTIVVAASSQQAFELPVRERGAIAYLVEPMTPRRLAELVEQVLKARQAIET